LVLGSACKQLQENQAVAWILKTKEKNLPEQESRKPSVLVGLKKGCALGYSDFHNLMRFTSKKMPNNILKNVC
jgi:hypothetical protein